MRAGACARVCVLSGLGASTGHVQEVLQLGVDPPRSRSPILSLRRDVFRCWQQGHSFLAEPAVYILFSPIGDVNFGASGQFASPFSKHMSDLVHELPSSEAVLVQGEIRDDVIREGTWGRDGVRDGRREAGVIA